LPPGLAVGRISSIDDDKVAVVPVVDWERLEYVRLLEYSRVVPPETLARLQREVHGPPPPPAAPASAEPAGAELTVRQPEGSPSAGAEAASP
jgi:hypothetical protein